MFDGEAGSDLLAFPSSGPVTVDLTTGQATGFGNDTLRSIEDVIGTDDGDTLIGNGARNRLFGFAGPDHIEGRGGDDFLNGGAGTDVVDGGNGSDTCMGGETLLGCEM